MREEKREGIADGWKKKRTFGRKGVEDL